MKKIVIVFIIALIIFGVYALWPHRINKIYDFKQASAEDEDFIVKARLMGTYESKSNITILTSPYDLHISIYSKNDKYKDATALIKAIRLKAKNKIVPDIMYGNTIRKELKQDIDGKYVAYFSFESLNLEYANYILQLDGEIILKNKPISKKFELNIEKKYKEFRSNDFISALKGV